MKVKYSYKDKKTKQTIEASGWFIFGFIQLRNSDKGIIKRSTQLGKAFDKLRIREYH